MHLTSFYPRLFVKVALLLFFMVLGFGAARYLQAQTPPPELTADPPSGAAGRVVQLTGRFFEPGGYGGFVLWNGEIVESFQIPQGGSFTIPYVIPLDAAPDSHLLSVCAGNDTCFSGDFQQLARTEFKVTESAPTLSGHIAYVYGSDRVTASNFSTLLIQHGFKVTPILVSQILETDFSLYELVIIANDTGNGEVWGSAEAQFKHLAETATKILGIGQGGHAFFGKLGLVIGWPNSEVGTFNGEVAAASRMLSYYTIPYDFSSLLEAPISLYADVASEVTVHQANMSEGVTAIGHSSLADFSGIYTTLIAQDCTQLWGYQPGPDAMTALGRSLFVNAVVDAISRECSQSPRQTCSEIFSPSQIPQPSTINFDNVADATTLATVYQASHGVTFVDNNRTRTITYGNRDSDPTKALSAPNVATNDAKFPNTSANVPLVINFAQPKTHVGFYMGNGENQDRTGVLTAFDAGGAMLCEVRHNPVPEEYTEFIGIQDTTGSIVRVTLDYGDTLLSESIDDLYFAPAMGTPQARQIQVCRETEAGCVAETNAIVHHIINGQPVDPPLSVGIDGLVTDASGVQDGHVVWAMTAITQSERYTLYYTSEATTVTANLFNAGNVMQLPVSAQRPLMVHDLDVSAQWYVEGDPNLATTLAMSIAETSNYFYDFTDGQFVFGQVKIYQDYANWPNYNDAVGKADVQLWSHNNLRPKATAGGVVTALMEDPDHPDVIYRPGYIQIGTHWNRFNKPPQDPSLVELVAKTPTVSSIADLRNDWQEAFAHEFGHYWLHLFDTYFKLEADNKTVTQLHTCTGSAMGWVYEPENWGFVYNARHWENNCGDTRANQLLGRDEWSTIQLWYPWVRVPMTDVIGPHAPPVPLTKVDFVPVAGPIDVMPNQIFDLQYQNLTPIEGASQEARALIVRNDRVLDQGNPAQGSREMHLTGAQVGDRFCLIDINQRTSAAEQRFHYGCENLESGDNALFLEEDTTWAPVIDMKPITPGNRWAISVTQVTTGLPVTARLYPEHKPGSVEISLADDGTMYSGLFDLANVEPAIYVEVKIADETATEENPTPTAFIDIGTSGGTVPGPAAWAEQAPVYSSDGVVEVYPNEIILLEPGQFVSVIRYLNTYELPSNTVMTSAPYGIVAFPASLASSGVINIRLAGSQNAVQSASLDANRTNEVIIHRWNGSEWQPLETSVSTESGGTKLASASIHEEGIYIAALVSRGREIYLPLVAD